MRCASPIGARACCMPAYVSIRQHTSTDAPCITSRGSCLSSSKAPAYVSIRQHTSAYGGSIRPHTSAYITSRGSCSLWRKAPVRQHTSAYVVSIRQHTSAYITSRGSCLLSSTAPITVVMHGCRRLDTSRISATAYVSIRPHTSAYVSIRQHTS
jgi:hypothetical protein